jgi:hypothetical protein
MLGKRAQQHNPQVADSVNLLGSPVQFLALGSVAASSQNHEVS